MDGKELFVRTLSGDNVGIPLCLRDLTLGIDATSYRTDEIFSPTYDFKKSAECVLALQKMVGHHATMGCISSYSMEAFGGKMEYPPNGIPYVTEYPFDDIDVIDNFSPSDVIGDLVKGMRQSCLIVKEKRPDLALCVNVPGPVTMAGFLRRLETVMMDIIINPDIVKKLTTFCTEAIIDQADYVSKGIADAVYLASASDNPDMMGDDYSTYSIKGVKRIVSILHANEMKTIFHPHGIFSTDDRHPLLMESIATGADGFQFAEGNDPSGIIDAYDRKCVLLGGLNAYSSLLLGPEERIIRETEEFIHLFSNEKYIMTCSCSVNRGLPINNLTIMSEVLKKHNGAMI